MSSWAIFHGRPENSAASRNINQQTPVPWFLPFESGICNTSFTGLLWDERRKTTLLCSGSIRSSRSTGSASEGDSTVAGNGSAFFRNVAPQLKVEQVAGAQAVFTTSSWALFPRLPHGERACVCFSQGTPCADFHAGLEGSVWQKCQFFWSSGKDNPKDYTCVDMDQFRGSPVSHFNLKKYMFRKCSSYQFLERALLPYWFPCK